MRHNIRFLLIVTMLLLVTGSGTAQKFVHPGIDMNSADLEYMRNQVLAGKQPWKDAYDLLKEKTPLDFQVKPFAHVISGPIIRKTKNSSFKNEKSKKEVDVAITVSNKDIV